MRLSNWSYQPPESDVVFDLRPLNLETLYELQRSRVDGGVPDIHGARLAFEYGVVGWKNAKWHDEELQFSAEAKARLFSGEAADSKWLVYLMSVAAELYKKAFLSEDERKNS